MGGDAKIPYGRTTAGAEHDILDSEGGLNYFCPECQYQLERRFGPKLQYFAHWRGAHDGRCPWLSGTYTPEGLRLEAIRDYSTAGRMRIFVVKDPYVDAALLQGAIPGITREDVTIAKSHGNLTITHQTGLQRAVSIGALNSDGIAYLELDPSAEKFALCVSGPRQIRAVGEWQAAPLQRGDVFIGDDATAELVRRPTRVASGDHVYIIARPGDNGPHGAKKLALGDRTLIVVEANPLSLEYLRTYVNNIQLDDYPMRVNVVLPLELHPQAERFIRVPHGTALLLSIVPPIDSDPEFEIIPIPLRTSSYRLPRMGKGVARLLKLTVKKEQPISLLVHWPGRVGRDKFLDIGVGDAAISSPPAFQDAEIGCYVIRGERKAFASSLEDESMELVLEIDPDNGIAPEEVFLRTPGDMRVTIEAEVLEGDKAVWTEQGDATVDDFVERTRSLFMGGARELRIGFGPLGRVTLRCTHFFDKAVQAIEETRQQEIRDAAEKEAAIAARKARQERQAAEAAERAAQQELQRAAEERAMMERTEQQLRERSERERTASLERDRLREEARRVEAERAAKAAAAAEAERRKQQQRREKIRIEALIRKNLEGHNEAFPHRASLSFTARMMELPSERSKEAEPWRSYTRRLMREIARARPREPRVAEMPAATEDSEHPALAGGSTAEEASSARETSTKKQAPAGRNPPDQDDGQAPPSGRSPPRPVKRSQKNRTENIAELRNRRAEKRAAELAAARASEAARKRRVEIAAAERKMRAELGERYRRAIRVLKDRSSTLPESADDAFVCEVFEVESEAAAEFGERYAEVIAAMLDRERPSSRSATSDVEAAAESRPEAGAATEQLPSGNSEGEKNDT